MKDAQIYVNFGSEMRKCAYNHFFEAKKSIIGAYKSNGKVIIDTVLADFRAQPFLELIFDPDDFSLESVDNKVMEIVLKMCWNNKVRAAELLKVNRSKFYRRKLR